MKKRQSTVQKFSTFLVFADAVEPRMPDWISDAKLEQAMQRQVEAEPEKTDEQWAIHFLAELDRDRELRSSQPSIAARHLSAYLQEACYEAAQKLYAQFQSVQYRYTIADLFAIGHLLAHQPQKLFYRDQREYQQGNLESNAATAIFQFMTHQMYQQNIQARREQFSDYRLLRDLSQKELRAALAAQRVSADQIDSYCLANHCFNAVCKPQHQRHQNLEAPSSLEWEQIAACYNQRQDQLKLSTLQADTKQIQFMLDRLIDAARQLQTKRM